MKENKKDLYPNLGLTDIIKILHEKDRERLALEDFSRCGVEIISDLSYKGDGDFYHDFDIYYGNPRSETLPTIIMVHGGGLVYGRKELNKNLGISFAQNDFNVANINYRLLPNATLRDQIKEVLDAITYIVVNAKKLKLDADRIFLSSDSAGSFLTFAAYALIKDRAFREIFKIPAEDIDISGMCLISPMTGLIQKGSLSLINKPARKGLNEKQILFTENILTALVNTALPPTIIVTSEEDFIRNQALGVKKLLDDKNIPNKLLDFKKITCYNLGHSFLISHPGLKESKLVLDEISYFFKNI